MAGILYSVYAVVVLLVGGAGLLWIGFSSPGAESSQLRERALMLLGVVFLVALIALYVA
jgi:hypothetical protein